VKKKPKHVRLTAAQSRSWVQFNYYSFENPKPTFEQVAHTVLGLNPFPRTPQGRKFGSAQEFDGACILSRFLKNDKFCFCDRHALRLEQ
jgi:hypothetical protein